MARDNPLALYHLLAGPASPAQPKRAKPARVTEPLADEFAELWPLFPKRDGANPRKTAEAAYVRARSRGIPRETINAGIRALAAEWRGQPKDRLRFVPQAVTWLNQERWADATVVAHPASAATVNMGRHERFERFKLEQFKAGKPWPMNLGPRPGEPGCKLPEHLLREYGFLPKKYVARERGAVAEPDSPAGHEQSDRRPDGGQGRSGCDRHDD